MSADLLRTVLDRRPDDLPEELGEIYRFTERIVVDKSDDDALREAIRDRWARRP